MGVCVTPTFLGSEDNFMESVLPFNLYVGSGDRTHVVRLAFQALCRLSHLMGPINYFLIQFEKKESIGED